MAKSLIPSVRIAWNVNKSGKNPVRVGIKKRKNGKK